MCVMSPVRGSTIICSSPINSKDGANPLDPRSGTPLGDSNKGMSFLLSFFVLPWTATRGLNSLSDKA